MGKQVKQDKANELLALHPEVFEVYITEDNQSFFHEGDAKNHTRARKFKTEPEVFFREGYQSEDAANLEAIEVEYEELSKEFVNQSKELQETQLENEQLIKYKADLENANKVLQEEMQELKSENQTYVDKNEALETETKELKGRLETLQVEFDAFKVSKETEAVEEPPKKTKK